ncbi:Gfo/Idh/MocA family protein [Aureibaculum conchae]|uniref:Gfo/Idh/MocA family protein n=1 Tax=Aureibaculum sp. 2308TA14-22 TaxID=3108392 RepID=UPI003395FD3F
MKGREQNRRTFLKQSSIGALGLTILPWSMRAVAPSDTLRVAHIGVGGMGNSHIKWFANLPEVKIVALCDVDQTHLASSIKNLATMQPDWKVDTYEDFRHILDRQDIDAITCATPDHWHATIGTLAFQAGKDVYGEKPLSYDVREGQKMLAAQQKHKSIFQLGTQIHAGDNYHRVAELIKSGVLGNIHTVRLWKTGGAPELKMTKGLAVPSTLNWDMWQGPAPERTYFPERCHFTYRYFLDYSGGVFADFWCHIADVVYMSLRPKGLRSISARGEEAKGLSDTPGWIDIDYKFDNLNIHWTTEPPNVPGAKDRSIGAYFEGEKGTLICDYSTREITINGQTVTDLPEVPISIPRSPGHQQNFVDSVKSRIQPESNLEYAREMTLPMHLGLISWRLGESLKWNPEKEKFIGNGKANKLLRRKARKAWKLI